mmetsp:Transcript_11017/g.29836  ORF Transcript_11017/g.29836 Transcript_11017/m.29836 type:complete len:325 (+) Transcript_11017:606-1580(+)
MSFKDALQRHNHLYPQGQGPLVTSDGPWVKKGIPVGVIPAERQSLPLPTDAINFDDPVRSQVNLEPLTREKPRRTYEPPPARPANWITLNSRLRDVPRTYNDAEQIAHANSMFPDAAMQQLDPRRAKTLRNGTGLSSKARRATDRAHELEVRLNQKRAETSRLENELAALRMPPPPRGQNQQESSLDIWPRLTHATNAVAAALAKSQGLDTLVPEIRSLGDTAVANRVPEQSRRAKIILDAASSAYKPAGGTQPSSFPWTYSATGERFPKSLTWGRPGDFGVKVRDPSPVVKGNLGIPTLGADPGHNDGVTARREVQIANANRK